MPRSDEPFTDNVRHGVVVPMPTLPFAITLNKLENEFEAVVVETLRRSDCELRVLNMSSLARGVEVPMPMLPVLAWA
jgi:hypothetical protein